jgi:hypothetical protein
MFAIAPKNLQSFDVQSLGAVDSKAQFELFESRLDPTIKYHQ